MEVSGQVHAPAALPPGKEPPDTHWIGGWVGPSVGLDDMEKRKFWSYRDSNSDPSVVQPVGAIPAHLLVYIAYWNGTVAYTTKLTCHFLYICSANVCVMYYVSLVK
jgi:hypothetical protein